METIETLARDAKAVVNIARSKNAISWTQQNNYDATIDQLLENGDEAGLAALFGELERLYPPNEPDEEEATNCHLDDGATEPEYISALEEMFEVLYKAGAAPSLLKPWQAKLNSLVANRAKLCGFKALYREVYEEAKQDLP